MKQAIIFDLDGTLWDSSAQILPVWCEVLGRHGFPPLSEAELASFMGKTEEEIAAMHFPRLALADAMAIVDECFREEAECLRHTGGALYPAVAETLRTLKKSCFLALVSNCGTAYLDAFFEAHGLGALFDDYETNGRTGLGKGDNIRLILQRNALERAVYVGDTVMDRQAAEEAGIPFIHAAYGFGSVNGARLRIDSFDSLPDMIREL